MAPTLVTACTSLPPEGAAAPAAWQSQFRGPGLKGLPPRSPLRVIRCPRGGRCACGPAKPVPRPLLEGIAPTFTHCV
jgi:hypothetical protein